MIKYIQSNRGKNKYSQSEISICKKCKSEKYNNHKCKLDNNIEGKKIGNNK